MIPKSATTSATNAQPSASALPQSIRSGPTRAESYRRRAADCESRARHTDNPFIRRDLQARATAWRQLARDAEMVDGIAAAQRVG